MSPAIQNSASISTAGMGGGSTAHGQRALLGILVSMLILALVAYGPSFASMVEIWLRSDTYLHGFLIAPISLFLIWRRRALLEAVPKKVFWPGVPAILGLSLVWWLSRTLGIQVGEQLIAVLILPAIVLTVAGVGVTRAIMFPLAYLIFAVPFGEFLIPTLIEFTATFTVNALNVIGVPVLRENQFFSTPNGNFEVARACSGIRYLLATIALGTIYAYVSYSSLRKRLIFTAFSVVLPLIANGLRAFLIVLVAEKSGMQLAVGIDHIIFGWLFFGVVVGLMFYVGERFRDTATGKDTDRQPVPNRTIPDRPSSWPANVTAAIAVALVLLAGPAIGTIDTGRASVAGGSAAVPIVADRGGDVSPSQQWWPAFRNPTSRAAGRYRFPDGDVDLAIVQYVGSSQDAELVNSENRILDPELWRIEQLGVHSIEFDAQTIEVLAVRGERNGMWRHVWYWFDVNGRRSLSREMVKLREAIGLLTGVSPVSTLVVISTSADDEAQAAQRLRGFLGASLNRIEDCLHDDGSSLDCRAGEDSGGTH